MELAGPLMVGGLHDKEVNSCRIQRIEVTLRLL